MIVYSAVAPFSAVTRIETRLSPVFRPVAPVTRTVALSSLGVATTSTDPVPLATSNTPPAEIAVLFTVIESSVVSEDSGAARLTVTV